MERSLSLGNHSMTEEPTIEDPETGLPLSLVKAIKNAAPDGTISIAYSGGVDSRFLAFASKRVGMNVCLLHVKGPHISKEETEQAILGAEEIGLKVEIADIDPLAVPEMRTAGKLRCYVCKKALFSKLLKLAKSLPLCDGTNMSDLTVYRPGRKALEELGIHSPLAEARIYKPALRQIAARLGMPRPDQAARPCLLTRFPYGSLPSREKLDFAARLEKAVASDPFGKTLSFRVRFPDGKTPELHVAASSLQGSAENKISALKERLLSAFPEELASINVVPMEKLSGYFDRI